MYNLRFHSPFFSYKLFSMLWWHNRLTLTFFPSLLLLLSIRIYLKILFWRFFIHFIIILMFDLVFITTNIHFYCPRIRSSITLTLSFFIIHFLLRWFKISKKLVIPKRNCFLIPNFFSRDERSLLTINFLS